MGDLRALRDIINDYYIGIGDSFIAASNFGQEDHNIPSFSLSNNLLQIERQTNIKKSF
jgi:hypothetical protein